MSAFKSSKNVWSQDAMLRDMTKFTLSKKETDEVNKYLSECGKLFNQISSSTLKELESKQDLAQLIEQFNNKYVRKGQIVKDTTRHTAMLIRWIKLRFGKEINSLFARARRHPTRANVQQPPDEKFLRRQSSGI